MTDIHRQLAASPYPLDNLVGALDRAPRLPAEHTIFLRALTGALDRTTVLAAIVAALFGPGGCGFQGDTETYYSHLNSYIDTVLLRRKGIPLSLCALTKLVAAHCGLRGLHFSGMPGHVVLSQFLRPPASTTSGGSGGAPTTRLDALFRDSWPRDLPDSLAAAVITVGDPVLKRNFYLCDAFRGGALLRPNLSDVSSIPRGKLHTPLLTILKRAYFNLAKSTSTDGSAGDASVRCLFLYQTAVSTIASYEYDKMVESSAHDDEAAAPSPNGVDDRVYDRTSLLANEVDGESVQAVFKLLQIAAMMGYEPLVHELTALLGRKYDWVGPVAAMAQQAAPTAKQNAEELVGRARVETIESESMEEQLAFDKALVDRMYANIRPG